MVNAGGGGTGSGSGEIEERVLLTPILGAHDEGPLSYLLEVDETRILLDCGWDEHFNPSTLEPLRKVLPTVDVILISCGDIAHMGALPYALKHFGLQKTCKIRCTRPVKELGLRTLYDAYLSRATVGEFDVFDLDDIDAVESEIEEGGRQFMGKSVSMISISAILAGRVLGACMWKIVREPDEILYAVDFSVGNDSLLDGIANKVEKLKPTLLVTDAFNYQAPPTAGLRQRNDEFCKKTLHVLRRNKNVIMPVDCAGRVLELLYVLNDHWKQNNLTYPIVWITSESGILDVAQFTMTDFMNQKVTEQFSRTRKNPFDRESLSHVQIASSVEQASAVRDPKVILASSGSMESGSIRELLLKYGTQDGHMLLLTDKTMMPDSLTCKLVQHLRQKNVSEMSSANYTIPDFKVSQWVYKTGQELVLWKMQRKERQAAEARRRHQREEQDALQVDIAMDGMDMDVYAIIGGGSKAEQDSQDSGQEDPMKEQVDQGEQQQSSLNLTASGKPSLQRQSSSMFQDDAARTGGGLYSVFAQKGNATKNMFSAYEPERTKRWDEYGEVIHEEDFLVVNKQNGEVDSQQPQEESDSGEDSSDEELLDTDQDGTGEQDVDKKKSKKKYGNPVEDAFLSREKRNRLPRECVTKEIRVHLRCALAYVDLESRAKLKDACSIVKILAPKKVVVVHTNPEGTATMVRACQDSGCQTVLAPKKGETADVSSDVGMWRVELDRGLFDPSYALYSQPRAISLQQGGKSKKQKLSGTDTVGIRYIEGIVGESQNVQVPLIEPLTPAVEGQMLARSVEPQFVHSNVNRAEILRRLLQYDEQEGLAESDMIQASLNNNGIITCRDAVNVLVEDGGERLLVEGPVSKTFFTVRKLVHQSYERI